MTATPQPLADCFVPDTADTAAEPRVVTLSNGNTVVIDAAGRATNDGFAIRAQQFERSGNPVGEEITFLFANAWGTEIPEFDVVVLGKDRIAIVSLNPFDVLAVRDFEARRDGFERFQSKSITEAGRSSGEDCLPPTNAGLGNGTDRVHWIHPQANGVRPETGHLDMGLHGPGPAEITVLRYNGTRLAALDPDPSTNGGCVPMPDCCRADGSDGHIRVRGAVPDGSTGIRTATGDSGGRTPDGTDTDG